jgi:hypothetical protein
MKVEECIVTVERRSMGGCLDLAFVFAREFSGPLFRLWLICAVPSCVLVWLLASVSAGMLLWSLVIFLFFSSVFSALLVACIGPQVFGVPISVRASLKAWRKRFWGWLLLSFVLRMMQVIIGICVVFPAIFVTAYGGHMPEVLLLEQAHVNNVTKRLSWLAGGGGYARNLGRLLGLMIFWFVMSFGLFLIIDFLATSLFNVPIFFKIAVNSSRAIGDVLSQLLYDDPKVLTVIQLTIWLPYPVIRLAWFFCYLDQRTRNECWDLQLQFRAEATRLEELAL